MELSLQEDKALQAERAQKEALVASRLELMQLRRVPTAGGGNCQFRAICVALGFPEDAHGTLRQRIAAYLAAHRDDFVDFVVGPEGGAERWNDYIDDLQGTEWGDEVTLTVASRMFRRTITVVSDRAGLQYVSDHTPPDSQGAGIVLAHYGEFHYESTAAL